MASAGGEWGSMSLGNNELALCHNTGRLNCESIDPLFLNFYILPNSSLTLLCLTCTFSTPPPPPITHQHSEKRG